MIATERVLADEATARGVTGHPAPSEAELLPDVTARLEIGSVAAAVLAYPRVRALFAEVTADVRVGDDEVAAYHARNPLRFAAPVPGGTVGMSRRWPPAAGAGARRDRRAPVGAARRRAFRVWLDGRRAALVQLAPGYEHPGDPRQPDNTHRH
ncbi:putative malonyl CoA-acyl carrier protein transacylase, FabD2 [Mycobacterium ulcerans str. Harvey]|uniref:Malonyl CoA-acyl carrier protein transacylase, FabD2 n=1 Tax=Mycobacterium ulcerans str. Harvey TaxID=1299332 RepID=A0ABN0R5J9_MYCUL|nr:putative malonyl CoA-acyl carrier protein transacylase, FabD2 [Mycobacterium ulcerans str. Harvey]